MLRCICGAAYKTIDSTVVDQAWRICHYVIARFVGVSDFGKCYQHHCMLGDQAGREDAVEGRKVAYWPCCVGIGVDVTC